jgi:hypothetical protein
MSTSDSSYKPRILALNYPEYVPQHYMKEFTSKFNLDVSHDPADPMLKSDYCVRRFSNKKTARA